MTSKPLGCPEGWWDIGDEIVREAAYANMVVLIQQVCEITGTSPSDWTLSSLCSFEPIRVGETRIPFEGETAFANVEAQTLRVEMPASMYYHAHYIQTQVPDRCSIGSSGFHAMIDAGWLLAIYIRLVPWLVECDEERL